ncbi:MAG TPA: hypothetical protein PK156_25635, partial [Polyangium sp.]|nr:hypothetical protein [Polyangium sp.]
RLNIWGYESPAALFAPNPTLSMCVVYFVSRYELRRFSTYPDPIKQLPTEFRGFLGKTVRRAPSRVDLVLDGAITSTNCSFGACSGAPRLEV